MQNKIRFLIPVLILLSNNLKAQNESPQKKDSKTATDTSKQWYFQTPVADKNYGIALSKAYAILPKDISPTTIIVAVIDGGVDSAQEDLKSNIWVNTREITGNGIDDDHNGYVDDVHGWSFIGGKTSDVDHDNDEITRLYKLKKSGIPSEYSWRKIRKAYHKEMKSAKSNAKLILKIKKMTDDVSKSANKVPVSVETLEAYHAHGLFTKLIKKQFVGLMKKGISFEELKKEIDEGSSQVENIINYNLNTDYDTRNIVGDNYSNLNERFYGNTNITGPEASHGTHVAGIIGAVRNNSLGIDGIASNVKIMVVRVVPDGDERDKDVANGIRYAVDNGAKIINMSFGKAYSPDQLEVDAAVKYAVSKGVLLIHAAGNEAANIDVTPNFPSPNYKSDSTKASTWIEVGASDNDGNAALFSNYGQKTVDLFAPGQQIYSTLPNNDYGYESGTSMSAPVVSGIAALVWSYYPTLSAEQVKEILLSSAVKRDNLTPMPGNARTKVKFSILSSTGGIINAATALEIAAKAARH